MRYHGGKARLARQIAGFLKGPLSEHDGRFVEPFVGGFNIIPKLAGDISNAWCSDNHPGLIKMYQALKGGWEPQPVSVERYAELRARLDWNNPETAFAAFGCSYAGKEWGGYARSEGRDYANESRLALLAKAKCMGSVEFCHKDYLELVPTKASLIYCDPPYIKTTAYRTAGHFDHETFYEWCEQRASEGNTVFVSEFSAPEHWEIAWERERSITMRRDSYGKATERLYRVTSR